MDIIQGLGKIILIDDSRGRLCREADMGEASVEQAKIGQLISLPLGEGKD